MQALSHAIAFLDNKLKNSNLLYELNIKKNDSSAIIVLQDKKIIDQLK